MALYPTPQRVRSVTGPSFRAVDVSASERLRAYKRSTASCNAC